VVFSLDAARPPAPWLARRSGCRIAMRFRGEAAAASYEAARVLPRRPAGLRLLGGRGGTAPARRTVEHFLTERYLLFSQHSAETLPPQVTTRPGLCSASIMEVAQTLSTRRIAPLRGPPLSQVLGRRGRRLLSPKWCSACSCRRPMRERRPARPPRSAAARAAAPPRGARMRRHSGVVELLLEAGELTQAVARFGARRGGAIAGPRPRARRAPCSARSERSLCASVAARFDSVATWRRRSRRSTGWPLRPPAHARWGAQGPSF